MDAATFQTEAMKHKRLLWRVSWSMLSRQEDCDDAVQEALARAWKQRETLRNPRAFRPWLVRILTNTCHDMIRRQMQQKALPLDDEAIAVEPLPDPLPLREAIDRLSPEHRTVIVLHYLEGASVREIARMLGIPSGTVKSRLLYARGNLREMLHESIDD